MKVPISRVELRDWVWRDVVQAVVTRVVNRLIDVAIIGLGFAVVGIEALPCPVPL